MPKQLRRSQSVKRAYAIKKLYYKDGYSMREIAARFDISSSTVHHYIHATVVRGVDVTDWESKK